MTLDQIADEIDAIRRIRWFKRFRTGRRLKALAVECAEHGDETPDGKMLHVVAAHVGLGLVMVGIDHPSFEVCLVAAANHIREHALTEKGGSA